MERLTGNGQPTPFMEDAAMTPRAQEILTAQLRSLYKSTDRSFAILMLFQWAATIVIAATVSPYTWSGEVSRIHPHVWSAVFVGGLLSFFPIGLVLRYPGEVQTRYVIAVAQMLMASLLIHITGGRIETHFHIFGSLAFLAFYRDWRILIPATIIVCADHFVRGFYMPQSIFGVYSASPWRAVEHSAWVVFEDIFLAAACVRSIREMRVIAAHTAQMEVTNQLIEDKVIERTAQMRESENLFKAFMNNGPIAASMKDEQGRLLFVNETLARALRISDTGWEGKTFDDICPPDVALTLAQYDSDVVVTRQQVAREEVIPQADGPHTWLAHRFPIETVDGRLNVGTIAVDITDRKQAEKQIQEVNSALSSQVEKLQRRTEEMHLVGEMGEMLQSCKSVEEADLVIGKSLRLLFPDDSGSLCIMKSSQDRVDVVQSWGEQITTELHFSPHDCWALRRGRSHIVNSANAVPCHHTTEEADGVGHLCVPLMAQHETLGVLHISNADATKLDAAKQQLGRAVAEQISLALSNLTLQETLRRQTIRDPLTNLFNRRYLEESLEREIHRAERETSPISLVMIDIDYFKRFNDTYGHDAGDAILRNVGHVLAQQTRKSDICCRYGGEEFLIVMPGLNLSDTVTKAEQLREAVQHLRVQFNGKSLGTITLSAGVATFPEHGGNGSNIFRAVDTALYQAKRGGRNRVVVADPLGADEVEPTLATL